MRKFFYIAGLILFILVSAAIVRSFSQWRENNDKRQHHGERRMYVGFFQFAASPQLKQTETNWRLGDPKVNDGYENTKVMYVKNSSYNSVLAQQDFNSNFIESGQITEMKRIGFIKIIISNGREEWAFNVP